AEAPVTSMEKTRQGDFDFSSSKVVYRGPNDAAVTVAIFDLRGNPVYYPRNAAAKNGKRPLTTGVDEEKPVESTPGVVGRLLVVIQAKNAERGLTLNMWESMPSETLSPFE